MIKNGLEYKECPECKRICLKPEITSDGICKDCLIESLGKENKRLEEELKTVEQRILDNWCRNEQNRHLRSIVDRARAVFGLARFPSGLRNCLMTTRTLTVRLVE